jgi:hypothetical protein
MRKLLTVVCWLWWRQHHLELRRVETRYGKRWRKVCKVCTRGFELVL